MTAELIRETESGWIYKCDDGRIVYVTKRHYTRAERMKS